MRERTAAAVVTGIGLGFLVLPMLPLLWRAGPTTARQAPPFVTRGSRARASRQGPADQALREAVVWEIRARQTAHEGDEALSDTGQEPLLGAGGATYRRRLADDAGARGPAPVAAPAVNLRGVKTLLSRLRRARRAALRAAQLARTPDEARRAAELMARLEGEADPRSRGLLRRSPRCSDRTRAEGEMR
jgi:hypothetical protein